MKKATLISLISGFLLICVPASAAYELVWFDEFDCETLNTTAWTYEIGTGYNGWGNWESQYYTSDAKNVYLADGNLYIKAIKDETKYNPDYQTYFTSGRIITKEKVVAKYGKIEARIKLPVSKKGVWPAFWMLGTSNNYEWPKCGETDIMEYMCKGENNKTVLSTLHWYSSGQADYGLSADINNPQDFHIYSLEWTPDYMLFKVDDTQILNVGINQTTASQFQAFHYPFFIILNLAIGGTYVGSDFDKTIQEEIMTVDYVRVYQDKTTYTASSLTDNSVDCSEFDECDMVQSWTKGTVYFAPGWNESTNYTFSASDRSASIHMGDATSLQWQAQFWCLPSVAVSMTEDASYDVSFDIVSTQNVPNATAKFVQNGNDGVYLFAENMALVANQSQTFKYTGKAPGGLTDARFVFDFGGNPANTDVTISNIKVKKSSCTTGVDDADAPAPAVSNVHKELRDGRIVIVAGDKVYNLMGVEIE